jgi:hypothetical protein
MRRGPSEALVTKFLRGSLRVDAVGVSELEAKARAAGLLSSIERDVQGFHEMFWRNRRLIALVRPIAVAARRQSQSKRAIIAALKAPRLAPPPSAVPTCQPVLIRSRTGKSCQARSNAWAR